MAERPSGEPLILAVDASTTAVKVGAFDASGSSHGEERGAIELLAPEPGGWEQDPADWWAALCTATRRLAAAIDPARLRGVCIAHQRETVVVTGPDHAPRHPALVWMDERCSPDVAQLSEELGVTWLHATTGKPPCVTPSLYKLAWLRRRHPALFGDGVRVADVGAHLIWRLTGRFATALGSADPTGLVDLPRGAWSERALGAIGLDGAAVPELVPSGARVGALTAEAASATGLPAGLPLFAGCGDGQAACLGAGLGPQGADAPGGPAAYLNLGTALVSGVVVPDYRTDRAYRTLAGAEPGTFLLETDLKGGTFTLNWLRERFATRPLDELEAEASALPPGSEGLMVVPYWCGVMNPYWDDAAAGVTVGWRGHHGPAHFYRAILEGLAMEQRLQCEAVEGALGGAIARFVVVGGGARSPLFGQVVADVMERPVELAPSADTTLLGAAMLGAVGAGLHASVAAARVAMAGRPARLAQSAERVRYGALFARYRRLYPALRAVAGDVGQE